MYFFPARFIHLRSNDFNNIGCYNGAHLSAFLEVFAFHETCQESGSPHVASPSCVYDLGFHGCYGCYLISTFDVCSFGSHFHHGNLAA